ncbi:ATP-binding protein [Streptomyces sp. NPDC001588]|uniref:ATP-binding protein n=1 Tax=Streptomyces sp. NPDC093676 TaxID=3366050 RepID=UPI00382C8853
MSKATSKAARPETSPPGGDKIVVLVPHILEVLGAVRRQARSVMAGWGVPAGLAEDVLLVISEMATNAITHALPPAILGLSCASTHGGCTLRVEVTDAGATSRMQRDRHGRQPEEHGRGTAIIAALSAQYGTYTHAEGVTRWAELPAT